MLREPSKSNGRMSAPAGTVALKPASSDAKITLGETLSPTAIWQAARWAVNPNKRLKIEFTGKAFARVQEAADLLDRLVASEEPVYGVNTGFGAFANVVISPDKILELQTNIVRSHCCGVGDLLPRDVVMAMWLINLTKICRGHSGVRPTTLRTIARILEEGVLACVPSQGSVGASGDLAPTAHAVLAMLGEGRCTMPQGGEFIEVPAEKALRQIGAAPLVLGPKEGLSLINGTCLTTALAVKLWYDGCYLLRVANLAAAMSMEALGASRMTCAEAVLQAHGHPGTVACGREVAEWLDRSSEMGAQHVDSHWIQDPYSLRCVPQVHGAVWEELHGSEQVLRREINAASDNPLLFPEEMMALNCGNFHAVYPARVCDRLASAFATLASISERRTSQAMKAPRGHLPTFLVRDGGTHSGFMMAHVTAAALVSESKSLSYPASVDSIPTNLLQEDHVSMGPIAGMKALRILDNLCRVLAIELLAAAQGISLQRPRRASARLEEAHAEIRQHVPTLETDRNLSEDIELIAEKIARRELLS